MKILKFKTARVAEKKAHKLAKNHNLVQVGKRIFVISKDK